MDEAYMRRALEIARYAVGRTSPNPLVGAVVVRGGRIVGEGWHKRAGTPHAEVHALRQAGAEAAGATIYVTLEPCAHHGRTPPCAEALIEAGIRRVVVAVRDPNPLVAGKGIARLRAAGIEVVEDVLAQAARSLNEAFFKWIRTRTPFVSLKVAMTLDGKTATSTGESKWITNEASRRYVHELRDRCDAVLTGIGTVLADDPALTARLPDGARNPLRVVVDSMARTPLTARVVTDGCAPTVVAVSTHAPESRVAALRTAGADVLVCGGADVRVDLPALLTALGGRGVTSVLTECGATLNGALLTAGCVDRVYAFFAPKLVGGQSAPTGIGGVGFTRLADAARLSDVAVRMFDGDVLVSGRVEKEEL